MSLRPLRMVLAARIEHTSSRCSDGARELDWTEVDRIQMSVAAIQITKKPASMIWFNISAATLPNFALLCAVLNTLRDSKV